MRQIALITLALATCLVDSAYGKDQAFSQTVSSVSSGPSSETSSGSDVAGPDGLDFGPSAAAGVGIAAGANVPGSGVAGAAAAAGVGDCPCASTGKGHDVDGASLRAHNGDDYKSATYYLDGNISYGFDDPNHKTSKPRTGQPMRNVNGKIVNDAVNTVPGSLLGVVPGSSSKRNGLLGRRGLQSNRTGRSNHRGKKLKAGRARRH